MKKYIFIVLVCLPIYSQTKIDQVIYASAYKNVNMFFRSPITTAIVGSDTYSFGFNREEKSTYGILKAIPGIESNLLITTENGNIFSFIIRYKKEISQLNFFINDSLAIGNINGQMIQRKTDNKKELAENSDIENTSELHSNVSKPITVNDYEGEGKNDSISLTKRKNDLYNLDKIAYYENYCSKEIDKDKFYMRVFGASNNVFLRLKNISYDRDELYFSLIIDNNSSLDYDVENLAFYIIAKNKSKKTSTQRIVYEPVHIYKAPERISAHSSKELVYVYKKFSINNQKTLLVTLSEYKGERNINLEISNSLINNPNSN